MKLDRYEVMCREDGSIFRLGQGKTSSSYKALDLDLQTPVVLKVMRQEFLQDDEARKRFLREARAAAMLRHPNVAMIYRLGEEDGTCFYAREFVNGETLESKVSRDGPLGIADALNVGLQVSQALAAVKKMNLVHRDIKPSNLMMEADGTIKIIDFGLTKSNPGGDTQGLELITLAGFVGTPDYASPEQLNEETVSPAADLYSLGVTIWFLLTGRPPFRGPMAQVMAKHLHSPPPFEELTNIPTCVVSLLAHMLEKDPAKRPASPSSLAEDIERCIAEVKAGDAKPVPGNLPTESRGPAPELKKMSAAREPAVEIPHRKFVLGEVLIGAAIAVIVYLILSRPVEPPPPRPAEAAIPSTPMEAAEKTQAQR